MPAVLGLNHKPPSRLTPWRNAIQDIPDHTARQSVDLLFRIGPGHRLTKNILGSGLEFELLGRNAILDLHHFVSESLHLFSQTVPLGRGETTHRDIRRVSEQMLAQ